MWNTGKVSKVVGDRVQVKWCDGEKFCDKDQVEG
jgi:hypothetical protein